MLFFIVIDKNNKEKSSKSENTIELLKAKKKNHTEVKVKPLYSKNFVIGLHRNGQQKTI